MSELEIEIAVQRARGRGAARANDLPRAALVGPPNPEHTPDTTASVVQEALALLERGRSDTLIIYTSAPWYRRADRATAIPTGLPVGPGAVKRRWLIVEKRRCWVIGDLAHRDPSEGRVVHDGYVLLLDDGRAMNIFSAQSHAIGKSIHLHVPGSRADIAAALHVYDRVLEPDLVLHDGDGGRQTMITLLARCVLAYE